MTNRLTGKVALITGTGAGIGRGCALAFARAGATVFGCDIDAGRALATVASVREAGFEMESAHPVDLTQPADVQRCVEQVIERHGRIDVVVNAGAINPQFAPLAQMSYEDIWVRTLVGEADIVFLMCKAVWPHLVAAGGGSIVNFASLAALRGSEFAGMLAHWPFFRHLFDDVEAMLGRTDLDIAAHYDALAGEGLRVLSDPIRREFDLTVKSVLRLRGTSNLLDSDPTLQRSITLRNPYIDPMHLMQVDLLQRWRGTGRRDEAMFGALRATISGIAQGLQATG